MIAPSNEIFVFGYNTQGRHGAGQALHALKYHGAKYGKPFGFQGNSYAIVTKDLSKGRRSIPLNTIKNQLENLQEFAIQNPHLTFKLNLIGCGLAGYTKDEMLTIVSQIEWPKNIDLTAWKEK